MFNNIGSKIKGLAKIFFIILVTLYSIAALVLIIGGFISGEPAAIAACFIVGALIVGLGILIAWLSNIMLYAFGQQVEMQEKSAILLEKIYNTMGTSCASVPSYSMPAPTYPTADSSPTVAPAPVCPQCGTQVGKDSAFCPNCGGKI